MRYFGISDAVAACLPRSERAVAAFEAEFASYVGVPNALATSYGRSALYLALRALGAQGREVVLPAFQCSVVFEAVRAAGAVPRFLDVKVDDFTFDEREVEEALTSRTAAILLTHYFGNPAGNVETIARMAKRRGVALIEDCAHGLGAALNGKRIGSFGDVGIFSLTKNLVNFGGGVLVSARGDLHRRALEIAAEPDLSGRRRLEDGFVHLAYGVQQILEKGYFSRVGTKRLWLRSLPAHIMRGRLAARRVLGSLGPSSGGSEPLFQDDPPASPDRLYMGLDPIRMHPRIAALARRQLRRIDRINRRRMDLLRSLADLGALHGSAEGPPGSFPVGSYLVLRLKDLDPDRVVDWARGRGLTLYRTWPARQTLRQGQDTPGLATLRDRILTGYLHPDLSAREMRTVRDILGEIAVGSLRPPSAAGCSSRRPAEGHGA